VLLPEDEGKAEAMLSCSNCHGLKQVITQKKTKAGWQTSVQKMIVTYQAPVAKEDIPVLVAYLAKHFGEGNPIEQLPLNVNTCSSAALERLPGISAETAKAIVECRRTGGAFTSVDDLRRVEGIDDAALKRIKPYIKAKD
jgi:competence protein ComEA